MILIDSLYINNSGGLRLLDYLVKSFLKKNVEFYLIADARVRGRFDSLPALEYLEATLKNRRVFYKSHREDFSAVLCFGNVPPPIKMNVPVYTYFHNVNRLNVTIYRSKMKVLLSWMKRNYMKSLKQNTEKWIVQTTYTKSELVKHFKEREDRVLIMPFYELPQTKDKVIVGTEKRDYCFIGAYTGNKGHDELIEAWRLLHNRGFNLTLHLTVDKANQAFKELENKYDFKELGVVNHGFVSFDKVVELYKQSKAIIYPSKNESLGLGLVEAIHYGCDVISSDLPFTYSVCNPSEVFNPYLPQSIVDAILEYEKGQSPKSTLTIRDQIDDLIALVAY